MFQKVTLSALATLALLAPAAAQVARPLGDERLAALATRYFADQWRLDPTRATQAGVHEYDDRLGSFTAEGYGERLALARRYLAQVRAIDPGSRCGSHVRRLDFEQRDRGNDRADRDASSMEARARRLRADRIGLHLRLDLARFRAAAGSHALGDRA